MFITFSYQLVVYPDDTPIYLGCYGYNTNILNDDILLDPGMTLDACFAYCKSHGKRYAGTRLGTTCHCGDDGATYDSQGMADSEAECDTPCAGNVVQICGGAGGERISIYDIDSYLSKFRACSLYS